MVVMTSEWMSWSILAVIVRHALSRQAYTYMRATAGGSGILHNILPFQGHQQRAVTSNEHHQVQSLKFQERAQARQDHAATAR